ncbi:transcriptional regulator MraZ [Amylibacter marinus]|uniref:Transcriptional regulator MraZ n=1 Tax=Amylibacter marinus TaxID=1475483 RepID=A0ABQ5VUM3_9RHOB|nr:division/cell wall cluster transcriptional repressor MraZ [Amylibacter marinus]GLQ34881.1 transcriptional regulator MraZ [Amylibacter marinus]
MARRFRGEFVQKVDAKGRVSIPAAFRRVLQSGDPDWTEGLAAEMVLVYGDHRRQFIEGYTMTSMEEVDARIAAMKRGGRERRMLERMFSGQSLQMSVDETGRIVLPPKLKDKLDLKGEALFIASVDTFQIWKPETYEQSIAASDAWLDDYDDDFDPLALLDEAPIG